MDTQTELLPELLAELKTPNILRSGQTKTTINRAMGPSTKCLITVADESRER